MARRIASSIVICCVLAAIATPSFAGGRSLEPRHFDPATDGDLVQVTVDGRTISAWTYRNGSETDIAIQSLDKASGRSGELVLIGRDDRTDQTRPALTVDDNGSVYLTFIESETGTVKMSARPYGTLLWTPAQAVATDANAAIKPSLRVDGGKLSLAYVANDAVVQRTFELIAPLVRGGTKLSDGPDPGWSDLPPFPTEEDPGNNDHNTTLDTPEDYLDIDATGISDGNTNGG